MVLIKIYPFLLASITVLDILSCCPSSKLQESNKNESDKCKYEILFDKDFLVNKDAIVKNKEIENCYLSVKNGAEAKKGKTKALKLYKFFKLDIVDSNGLMKINESGDKLEFVKVTKENAEKDSIYFFCDFDGDSLDFLIFKDVTKAADLNRSYKITVFHTFEQYMNSLLS